MYKSEKLANSLKLLIQSGTWKPHEKLPSLRSQCKNSGFSLITVMNAYHELEAQGLIYSKEKSGYFVADRKTFSTTHSFDTNQKIEINSIVFHYLKSIQGDHIIPLGSAFPNSQLLYSPKLIQILAQLAKRHFSYEQTPSLPPGNIELRKLIAQRYCMQGIQADHDDIVITSGGLDALNLALQAVTQIGDYIILQQTVFYGAWQAAERLGLKVITIPDHPEDGIDLQALEHAIEKYPIKACWFMLNCHNPIGYTVKDKIKEKLAKILYQHNIYLIEDDVYGELYFENKKPLSMKYFDENNLVLHCSSFSKILGADFRIGWVYAGPYSEKIQHIQLMSTLSVNSFIQNALVEYLSHRDYDKHLKKIRASLEKNKIDFYHFLQRILDQNCKVHYFPSGYFLWIELPKELDSIDIYQSLLSKNISIAPSHLFNAHDTKAKNYLRINCSFDLTASYQEALLELSKCINHAIQLYRASK